MIAKVHGGVANSGYMMHIIMPKHNTPEGIAIYGARHVCHQCSAITTEMPAFLFLYCEKQRVLRKELYTKIAFKLAATQQKLKGKANSANCSLPISYEHYGSTLMIAKKMTQVEL